MPTILENVHSEYSVIENSFPVSHEFVLVLGLNQLTIPKGKNRMKFNSKCSSSTSFFTFLLFQH